MTRTTREIERTTNCDIFWMAVITSAIVTCLILMFFNAGIQNQISQLPHRVCHNESSCTMKNIKDSQYTNCDFSKFENSSYFITRQDETMDYGTLILENDEVYILNYGTKEVCEIR